MIRLVTILFVCSIFTAKAQRTFIKHYGTTESEYGTTLSLTDDKGFLICQIITDPTHIYTGFVKTDENGNMLWSRVYNAHDVTVIKSMKKWRDGFIILGSTWDWSASDYRLVLMHINNLGDMLWMKEYRASAADFATGLSILNDEFYITAAADYNAPGVYSKIFWMKTDSLGNPLQSKMYGSTYMQTSFASCVNPSGKTGVASTSNSFGSFNFVFTNVVVTQLDQSGNIEWSKSIGSQYDDEPWAIDYGSDWLIGGFSYFGTTAADISVLRVDDNGNVLASDFYDAGTLDGEKGRSLIAKDNGFVLAGDAGTFDERNMLLMKGDGNGDITWSHQYPVSTLFTNYPSEVISLKNDSGYLFTGDLRPPGAYRNAGVFRTSSDGTIGCMTQPISFTKRQETMEIVNAPLNDVAHTVTTTPVAWQEMMIPVQENTICQYSVADFSFDSDTTCPNVCFTFTDLSTNAVSWLWEFPGGDPSSSTLPQPPEICYDSSANYPVKLTASDGTTTDVKLDTIKLGPICDSIFIPNVISPNGDFRNDQFAPKNLPVNFSMQIFNRWGNLIFETKDRNNLWPSRNDFDKVNDGVYYFVLETFSPAKPRKFHGTFSVITNSQ